MNEVGSDSGPGPRLGLMAGDFGPRSRSEYWRTPFGSQLKSQVCLVPSIPVSPASSGWSHESYRLGFALLGSSWPYLEQMKVCRMT